MLLRIGEKIINRQKIYQVIDSALELRSQGLSQQEVANKVGLDRTVISKLETLGEVRKGGKVALVGFPIKNCEELAQVARQQGVDYSLLMSENERWDYVEAKSGVQLFNNIMEIVARLRQYDVVIMLGSNMRIKLMEALLDKEVIGIEIGESPIAEDKYVDPKKLLNIISQLRF
ncbi:transcriptional regulator [Dendrosporobacter sp. 1207_IL3150]|uniref:transcriptional regulator n=1 Tax=Dendrosporobacter sp. 1207_IL3150 TaxID=3084054 RepID=UPI002FD90EA0